MKKYFLNIMTCILMLVVLHTSIAKAQTRPKNRVIVLTDITNEPDDAQSMVRFLLYSNHYDVEGLIATTSTHLRNRTAEGRIFDMVAAYSEVYENLSLHEPGFPSGNYLRSVVKKGIPLYGMSGVGPGMDSEGSDWIIDVVDRDDDRPVWISVWGGPNVLAQALWKVRQTRTPAQLQHFVSKLRVYTISDQDDSGYWMRQQFPSLFYIVSPGGYYRQATWSGISGEQFYRFSSGADTVIVGNRWLRENIIETNNPLGAQYPEADYIMEGDTPSFLSLINNGLNVPERPDFGGWGGRYELYIPEYKPYQRYDSEKPETRAIWTDAIDEVHGRDGRIYISNHGTIWRWRDAYQNDFAARMAWTTKSYADANHPPVAKLAGPSEIIVGVGESVTLDASGSFDPDADALNYKWIHYPEAGTFWHWRSIRLENQETPVMTLSVPESVEITMPHTTHVILLVTDSGLPALTRYQRVIVNIKP